MPLEPPIGKAAGQVYNIERAFGTFLGQMAESGASLASMVLKELLQNADDAGATEMSVMLDQRPPHAGLPLEFASLCGPALLVRNNSPFRLASEVGAEHDDFTALCDVAGGHKRALATAAGRFGIV
jgi:hypothetical protein